MRNMLVVAALLAALAGLFLFLNRNGDPADAVAGVADAYIECSAYYQHTADALAAYRTNVGYGTPTAAQLAAAYALDHHAELVPLNVAAYRSRRDAMVAAFRSAGWDIRVPDATMYLWLPVPDGVDDWAWVRALIDQDGVVVTPGVAFGDGGRGFFRISLVRDEATLAKAAGLIAARRRALLRAA